MLAVTSNAFLGDSNKDFLADWRETFVLFALPGSRFAHKALLKRNRSAIIIEHLRPPPGPFALLADLPKWLGHHLLDPTRPLLFLDRAFEVGEVTEEERAGRASPRGVRAELDEAGRLRLLRLGGMIATSPVLPPFLRILARQQVAEAAALDLLRTAFPDSGT
ncbi:hypothetical protein DWF04_022930 (plasmid) [Cereibacter sphaeroides f. sp. denitrificans]|nr:hypothetical protein DWF04_05595 [Cereibacter sphaeroides f. sp. denitrificans]